MNTTKPDLYKHLIEKHGEKFQYEKAIEEAAELIVALSHKLQFRASDEDVMKELADVEICINTIKPLLNKVGNYNQIYNDKITRINQREGLV